MIAIYWVDMSFPCEGRHWEQCRDIFALYIQFLGAEFIEAGDIGHEISVTYLKAAITFPN